MDEKITCPHCGKEFNKDDIKESSVLDVYWFGQKPLAAEIFRVKMNRYRIDDFGKGVLLFLGWWGEPYLIH